LSIIDLSAKASGYITAGIRLSLYAFLISLFKVEKGLPTTLQYEEEPT